MWRGVSSVSDQRTDSGRCHGIDPRSGLTAMASPLPPPWSFEGPRVRGEVLSGGGDCALYRPNGTMSLDVRLTLRTHDGALLHMVYGGRWIVPFELRADIADPAKRHQVDPVRYYFRTNPLFETGSKQYAWLNDIVCIGSGYLVEGGVAYKIFRVR